MLLVCVAPAGAMRLPGTGPGRGGGPGRGPSELGMVAASTLGTKEARSGVVAGYNRLLETRPYQTKALGTGITYIFSDSTAQLLEGDDRSLSERLARSLKFGAVGALWVGPLLAAWFQAMDALVPGRTLRPVVTKLLADQLLQGPFMIGTMYCWTSLSNGATLGEVVCALENA